ncbi:TRAP transporter substrate-binding protein [Bacillus alveayuensis]|jgi:TRAP-type mannitol/chloroaromatic compound transport system substrate-binding protein|uniref:TRAP transporter substrate-binding protein n=1 Tax=Aeribacillus alveayuensis TaxID=279215 RepID=UPI0005D11FAC|nr:TRAP transporter substrate-binding protein DctP [Bacillus alveayuensis]
MIIFLAVLVLSGCSKATVSEPKTNQNSNESSNTVDSAKTETASTSGKTYKWVAQSPWPSGTTLHWMAEQIAKDITEATGGRLQVEMHPAGTIVGAFDLLDAVSTGTLDAVHSWEGYWVGQIPAAGFFAAMPLGMDYQQYMTWVLQGEGRQLWEEAFKDYNIKLLPAGAYTPEVLYYANKPIRTLDDLNGLKVRGSGFWGQIQNRFGASVVAVPGGEVYQALERGVVDAAEFATPTDNWSLGFHEVTKYIVVPGAHQPTSTFSFMVNKDKWNEIPDDLKRIVQLVTDNMWSKAYAYAAAQDMQTMQKYKQLEEEGKLEIIEFDKQSQQKMKEVTDEFYSELAEKDPFFKKVWESQKEFLQTFNYWQDMMIPEYK